MKHTKRLLAAVMALTMVSAIAPMSAFADTEIKQDSTDKTGTMTATYDVTAKYTVTIPAGVTLDSTNAVSKNIEASDVMLESGKKIKVTLNSADHTTSGATFHAQTDKGDSTATYTISKGETAVAVGDVVAEFTENGEQSLTFSKAEGATYAGTHTETLTFGIAVESAKAAAEKPDIAQADCTFSPSNGKSTLSNANITTAMEYSADNGTTWTDVTSAGSIASLAAGTVQIRVKETADKLASEAVSITVPQVLQINELVGPYTGDRLTCEYYAGETWQALVDRYDLIKAYSNRAAFGSDGFIYYGGSMIPVTDLVDNTKTYEVQ